jgi:hypothetical protein
LELDGGVGCCGLELDRWYVETRCGLCLSEGEPALETGVRSVESHATGTLKEETALKGVVNSG